MTRRALLRASVAVSAFGGRASADQNQTAALAITIVNQSGVDVPQSMIDALQIQLDTHFGPVWGKTAVLSLQDGSSKPSTGQIVGMVLDYTDATGSLGYHFTQSDGTPYLRVFARTAQAYGQSVSSVLSHELMELLVNPGANSYLLNDSGKGWGYLYSLEVCDPVEASFYDLNGFTVSNFVTPRFYLNAAPAPYDYLGNVVAPFTALPGGTVPMKTITGLPSIFG